MDSNIAHSVEPQKPDGSARANLLRDIDFLTDASDSPPGEPETLEGQIVAHGTDFVKTALLFMPMTGKLGKAATVATGVVYGLSEMDSREGLTFQNLGRGAMGVTKGLGTRYVIGKIGAAENFHFAAKGVAMGIAARTVDVGCSPGTYLDSSGKFSLSTASDRMQSVLLDNKAIGMDFLVVGLAHLPPSLANRLGGKSVTDPLIKNLQMGATFGLATGTFTELDRQQRSGESFDGQKLAWSALSRGGLDALASVPGGLYGRRLAAASAMHATEVSTNQPLSERLAISPVKSPLETVPATLKPQIELGSLSFGRSLEPGSQIAGVKEFVVTGGDFRHVLDQRRGAALLTVQELQASTGKPLGTEQSLLLGHFDGNIRSLLLGDTRLAAPSIGPETRIASCNPQLLSDALRAQHLFPNTNGDIFLGAGKGNRITLATSLSLLPNEAPVKIALGDKSPWRTVSEMLQDPLVANDIAAQSARFNRAFDPARIRRWALEISNQKDLVPECAIYQGNPYGYFVGGEQVTIPLHPLVTGERFGPVLKFSTLDFRKSWGFREFPLGFKDAAVLDGPYRMTMPNGEFNHWYLQPRAESFGFHQMDLVADFEAAVRAKGRYCFWDYKVDQFGFKLNKNGEIATDSKGREQVVVLDYNAVVRAGGTILEPNEPRIKRTGRQ